MPEYTGMVTRMRDIARYEGSRDDPFFSGPTGSPQIDAFIDAFIDEYRDTLPTTTSRKLIRELLLHGHLQASGHEFEWPESIAYEGERTYLPESPEDTGVFTTNNGVLGTHDFNGNVYIRGGDSYHGVFLGLTGENEVQGAEGTLLGSGYRPGFVFVPHSNRDNYVNPNMEAMFNVMGMFSRQVRILRDETVEGYIVKDLSIPDPPAPYGRRDYDLPRIELEDFMLVPGNLENAIFIPKGECGL